MADESATSKETDENVDVADASETTCGPLVWNGGVASSMLKVRPKSATAVQFPQMPAESAVQRSAPETVAWKMVCAPRAHWVEAAMTPMAASRSAAFRRFI